MDNFWLQSLSWKQKLNALAFNNLFEARDLVNSLYNLALENNMEEKVKAKWVGILKFINYLIENIGNRSHSLALQQLREKYGGTKGMSKSDKKEADKILKRSGAVSAVCAPPPMWAPPPLMGPFPNMPFMAPTQQFSEMNIRRPFTGNCFNCNQSGHLAKDCPVPPRQQSRRPFNKGPKRFGCLRNISVMTLSEQPVHNNN